MCCSLRFLSTDLPHSIQYDLDRLRPCQTLTSLNDIIWYWDSVNRATLCPAMDRLDVGIIILQLHRRRCSATYAGLLHVVNVGS